MARSVIAALKRRLKPIPTDLFSYKDRTFIAEASDLRDYPFCSLITLVNPKTGREVDFDLVRIDRDPEDDVRCWAFQSADGLRILVYND